MRRSASTPQRLHTEVTGVRPQVVLAGARVLRRQAGPDQAHQVAVHLGRVHGAVAGHLGKRHRTAAGLERAQHLRADLDRLDTLLKALLLRVLLLRVLLLRVLLGPGVRGHSGHAVADPEHGVAHRGPLGHRVVHRGRGAH
jgi:hypothetical protein